MGFCSHGWGWGGGMPWGGSWGGLILSGLFLVGGLILFGLGIAWLVRQLRRQPTTLGVAGDPLEIVQRRLAAGEITIHEFEEIRDRLQS